MRRAEDGLSVLRLALDTTDPVQRRRVEELFSSAFSIRRAVQRDARDRTRAYWAARHERAKDPAAVRARVGLARKPLEQAAFGHLDAAPHLRRSVTKALALHLADSVWSATERHLFRDATGGRHGMPRPGGWFDFTRIPGRARSHTKERTWETSRLHGSLAGHRAAYARDDGRFFQPDRLRQIAEPSDGWWSYTGPLAVVFTGLPIGTLVLPVRLPAAPSNQPILDHHLADPARWHKIDLVRHRDATAAGGWRYEAHLGVLTQPYVAPAVRARRATAVLANADRCAGIDVNVSNVTVASHAAGSDLKVTRIDRDLKTAQRDNHRARRNGRRQRRLDRSRRARNPEQYELSKRQQAHNRRLEAAGRSPITMVPRGARKRRADGKPAQAYRRDQLSSTYRRERASQAAEAESTAQARRDFARTIAARLVRDHGYRLVVEDCDLRTWGRLWGRAMATFTPGVLLSALEREARTVAGIAGSTGGVVRASTRTTALSQHCLCGARVAKTLKERSHLCGACGLRGDRDAVAATLGACVSFREPGNPASGELDFAVARKLLDARDTRQRLFASLPYALHGRQDVQSESTAHSARDGWFIAEKGPTPDAVVAVARRIVGRASYPTPDETGSRCRTTLERVRTRANLHCNCVAWLAQLRDSS